MNTKKQYTAPSVSIKDLLLENVMGIATISNARTNSIQNDIPNGDLIHIGNQHVTGDGSDAAAKGGLSDWDNL